MKRGLVMRRSEGAVYRIVCRINGPLAMRCPLSRVVP